MIVLLADSLFGEKEFLMYTTMTILKIGETVVERREQHLPTKRVAPKQWFCMLLRQEYIKDGRDE